MAKARCCGYEPIKLGAKWGYLDGPTSSDPCSHVNGQRLCPDCDKEWYREGNDSTWDYELVGDPPRYHGGCAREACPACELDAKETT